MSLPSPNLDDRRFQDIVDEAKKRIPEHTPEWTDHNVSDPGIALIELFAWMTEMIIYRLNHIPESVYTRFLELMGISLLPASPATTDLTFWLSAPQAEPVTIPAGTQVGTPRTEFEESLVFLTDHDLRLVQPVLIGCITEDSGGNYSDRTDELSLATQEVTCFENSQAGEAIYFGFEGPLSGNTVRLDVEARIEGVGVDPSRPPWIWEVWGQSGWQEAVVYEDETGGLNTDGSITLLLPPQHDAMTLGPMHAHWLRCRMTEGSTDQPTYKESPKIRTMVAVGLGGTVSAHHGTPVPAGSLGMSDGSPGQVFEVSRTPVLPRQPGETVVVRADGDEEEWTEVDDFSRSGPDDRHFTWDSVSGEVRFGPAVRLPDGSMAQHGAIPPRGATIAITGYRYGGGATGNVGARTLTVMKSSIPYVSRVVNLGPARGGVDAETLDQAKARGPLSLRTGERAVTASDYERLTLEASREVARARCLPPEEGEGPIQLLLVPRLETPPRELQLDDLALEDEMVADVQRYLDERRTLGSVVEVRTPYYQGVTVAASIRAAPGSDPVVLRERALDALHEFINPITGGPQSSGWPFDRPLNVGELFALLSGLEGIVGVEEVLMFPADLRTGDRADPRQRMSLPPEALFASFEHQVRVL